MKKRKYVPERHYALACFEARSNEGKASKRALAPGVFEIRNTWYVCVYIYSYDSNTFGKWTVDEVAPVSPFEEFEFDGIYRFSSYKLCCQLKNQFDLDLLGECVVLKVFADENEVPAEARANAIEVDALSSMNLGVDVEPSYDSDDEEAVADLKAKRRARANALQDHELWERFFTYKYECFVRAVPCRRQRRE